jgi:hypothetical protein
VTEPTRQVAFNAPELVRDFIEDSTVVTGYFGPFGCAKTTAGAVKAWSYGQRYPGARGAIIRATWPELRDTTMKTFFEWFPDGATGRFEATPKTFWMHTQPGQPPQEILFRAMNDVDDVANVLSLDLAWAWIDEPQGGISLIEAGRGSRQIVSVQGVAHEVFKALLARCGRQKGYPKALWLTGNPPPPKHWIAGEFGYQPGVTGNDPPKNPKPDRRLYLGTQETNRHNLPPRYYEDLERDYGVDTPMSRRFLKGQWIDFVGEKPFQVADIVGWEDSGIELPDTSFLRIEAGVDPAISEKDSADPSAIVVCAQVRRGPLRGTIFELFHDEGPWGLYGTVTRMLALIAPMLVTLERCRGRGRPTHAPPRPPLTDVVTKQRSPGCYSSSSFVSPVVRFRRIIRVTPLIGCTAVAVTIQFAIRRSGSSSYIPPRGV